MLAECGGVDCLRPRAHADRSGGDATAGAALDLMVAAGDDRFAHVTVAKVRCRPSGPFRKLRVAERFHAAIVCAKKTVGSAAGKNAMNSVRANWFAVPQ